VPHLPLTPPGLEVEREVEAVQNLSLGVKRTELYSDQGGTEQGAWDLVSKIPPVFNSESHGQ
jgi:hypothetical protein